MDLWEIRNEAKPAGIGTFGGMVGGIEAGVGSLPEHAMILSGRDEGKGLSQDETVTGRGLASPLAFAIARRAHGDGAQKNHRRAV